MLAKRWREHEDGDAARKLVTSHLRLVARIAGGYRGYGLPFGDLIGEGNIGLMEAVKRFDPERGFRLSTYAMWWIHAQIKQFVYRSWSLVKLGSTVARKRLFFGLARLKRQLRAIDDGDLEPEAVARIARALDVDADDVVEMDRRLTGRDRSLNVPVAADGGLELIETLRDESPTPEDRYGDAEEAARRRELIDRTLETLSDREREIVSRRWLCEVPDTLEVLGAEFGVSRERVRQIEAGALAKLRARAANSGLADTAAA